MDEPPPTPMVKLTSKNHRTLPILDYYLTFIHYFGFGINPDDDHRSRYLSIRVKRFQTQVARPVPADSHNLHFHLNQHQHQHLHQQNQHQQERQWLASYTRRAQRKINSLPVHLFANHLKTTVKFMAIFFNIFIATNHCIVLVDYICSDSRAIEDIILDIRLVITKLSALIFVLSWHHKRAEVRQLIKLVKSTSLYILATHGHQLQRPSGCAGSRTTAAAGLGSGSAQPLLAPESPISSPTVAANTTTAPYNFIAGQAAAAAANTLANACSGHATGAKTTTTTTATKEQQQQPPIGQANNDETGQESISDEIGSSLRLDTSAFDRRILKGWFGCLLIVIVHFSLSEAEISKSYHLWQWLDDYSLHQLGNQSISYETLMFLATFDNYIYTVHVYGTRLIGASIICIVCSLQHEVIKSLNLYTLRLIRSSQQPLLQAGAGAPPGGQLDEDTMSIFSSKLSTKSSSESLESGGSQSSLLSGKKFELDSSTFFVLGESDWFRVRQLRQQLEPRGHLTAWLWRTWRLLWRWLCALLYSGAELALSWLRFLWNWALRRGHWRRPEQQQQQQQRTTKGLVDLRRVTPKNENNISGQITLGKVASSLISSSNGGAPERSYVSRTKPTPLRLSSPTNINAGANAELVARFMHAKSRQSPLFQFFTVGAPQVPGTGAPPATGDRLGFTGAHTALCWSNTLRSSDEYQARLVAMYGQAGACAPASDATPLSAGRAPKMLSSPEPAPANQWNALGARKIELQLERLSTKYELVRTVNARIDACFGPMLLIQFSFLFLMSCIDLVFFSLCFSPNTKTKYIIISGMILLWCPHMLIYKFASDMGSSSKELLVSIRRLARLYLLEDQAAAAAAAAASSAPNRPNGAGPTEQHLWSAFRVESTKRFLYNNYLLASSKTKQQLPPFTATAATTNSTAAPSSPTAGCGRTKIGAGIVDKLDHIFKPTHLSIMGVMTVDKFFLLNFAKIVITSSVMMIQFISN